MSLRPRRKSRLEIIQGHADGAVAYWCGLQHAKVETGGKSVPMTLRVTEIFRLEDGNWKLVHRHAEVAAGAQ
ncbi:nuclear transport factor 2 family protein [Mesorhizobium sp.]|uniref:nuclear transport factor 2 family protein n=1 Tax=Mesorhizobium sp. TaxID=1871066 RepID=UPI0039C92FC5